MCYLNPILLISSQRESNQHLNQHPHYGGRDHNGLQRSHLVGLQWRSTLPQKILKSEMRMLHFYNLQKTSYEDSPSWTNSSELLHTAEDSSSTADIVRPTGNHHSDHTLSNQALTCCVKVVQQNSYAQVMKELTEKQEVAASNSQNNALKQIHDVYDMPQSSSLMARVQELLAINGRDWRFIPLRGPRFWELGSSSNIHGVSPEENIVFSHCYLAKKLPFYFLRYRPV